MVRERGNLGSSSSSHYDDDQGSNSKSLRNRSKVFAKRTMSLKKKIYELTTLCDLDGCLIVKGPNGELETWPENRYEVEHVVQRYMDMNEEDRHKNNKDLSSFLIKKKKKLELDIDNIRNENDSKMKSLYPTWNKKLDELSEDSLREMQCSLESKLENVKSRVKIKKQMMMMNRGDDHQIENTNTATTTSTINPYSVKADHENFVAMGGGLNCDQDSPLLSLLMFNSEPQHGLGTYNINPPLVPQAHEFFDFTSHHRQQQQENRNLLPIRGTMSTSSMCYPGFGMMENHHPLHQIQYYTKLMGDDGNYSSNFVSLPPLPPTTIFSHDQPPALQACVPAAPSFQTGDNDHFLNSIYSHHQQQQQDFDFMTINEGDTY